MKCGFGLMALLTVLLAPPVWADEPEVPAPFQLIRALQALQTQIAEGSTEALAAQPILIAQIAAQFARTPDSAWADSRNAQAAAVFLFSGGRASTVRPMLTVKGLSASDGALIAGALAFVEGREKEAAALLGDISATDLPPGIGGHLALAQSALMFRTDPAKAKNLLDQARLLMPGSLVEEAALRRQIFMMEEGVEFDKFMLVSRQYFQRYRRSVYAVNYWKGFVRNLVRFALKAGDDDMRKIETFVADFDGNDQRNLFLQIAKNALMNGKAAIARQSARNAAKLANPWSADADRAALYEASALIVDRQVAQGVAVLLALEQAHLNPEDAALAKLATEMGKNLESRTLSFAPAASGKPLPEMNVGGQTMAMGRTSLQRTDRLLTKIPPR